MDFTQIDENELNAVCVTIARIFTDLHRDKFLTAGYDLDQYTIGFTHGLFAVMKNPDVIEDCYYKMSGDPDVALLVAQLKAENYPVI